MNTELLIQLVINGLIVGTLYGVVAMCFVLIYKSTRVVNFAQGEFLLIGACGLVNRLARENSSFNEIVQDYIDVLDMLKKWHSLEGQIAESRIKEYRNLRRELELEIEQFLLDAVKSESP